MTECHETNSKATMISELVRGLTLGFALVVSPGVAGAQSINAGDRQAVAPPFHVQEVASFDTPWALAFLPDATMLVTEKPGRIYLVSQSGEKTPVAGVPEVAVRGQNGLLDIIAAPDFTQSGLIYFTWSQPAQGGSRVVLSRARLDRAPAGVTLQDRTEIWQQNFSTSGGQPGGIIAFDPAGRHLFLALGDRMSPQTAQDPQAGAGKVLRLNLDGSTPVDNPAASAGGVPGQTWSIGHRNPYGLAFAPDGRLWLNEMGPRGGDELNLIGPGLNYGWAEVSNGDNYNGTPIPDHDTRPEFAAPQVYWTPVIAPAGMAFYEGDLFPDWRGTALIGGLRAQSLVQIGFDAAGRADEIHRWSMGGRIRDVAVAADGAVWLIEDANPGRLMRLTP